MFRRRRGKTRHAGRRMLIDVVDPEEIRVAIVGAKGLEEFYVERAGADFVHGNIYKGRVQNIEPGLQAAFVNIGAEKNGFLHISDIAPPAELKARRRKTAGRTAPSVADLLQKGQEVMVQIVRETLGNKGPSLTMFLSLPGRYLVLMPQLRKRGVSRKIVDAKEREELRQMLEALSPPPEMGIIIRTAGLGRSQDELRRDLEYLLRLWDDVRRRAAGVSAPATLYRESDLLIRAFRDYLYEDISEVIIDGAEEYQRARDFLRQTMPGFEERLRFYGEAEPLFHYFAIEKEIESIFARVVKLANGGEIVIEQTEAMVTIDVNTGSFKRQTSRATIMAINLAAASEIARQIRLRDLGGLIMIDFIDMEDPADRRQVEEAFREALRRDRARTTVLPISALGVMEMTRQRMRQSLEHAITVPCPACNGTGIRKNLDVLSLELIRRLRSYFAERQGILAVRLHPEMALPLANARRAAIAALESQYHSRVIIEADTALAPDDMRFCWKDSAAADESAQDRLAPSAGSP